LLAIGNQRAVHEYRDVLTQVALFIEYVSAEKRPGGEYFVEGGAQSGSAALRGTGLHQARELRTEVKLGHRLELSIAAWAQQSGM